MKTSILDLIRHRVGIKLSLITFLLVGVVFAAFALIISHSNSVLLEQRAIDEVTIQTKTVIDTISMVDNNLKTEATRLGKAFAGNFPGQFSIDEKRSVDIAGKPVPMMMNGTTDLNLNFSIPDRFTAQTGVTATIFAKIGSDFIRVSTSLKKENGERAIGTMLDHAHPGYARLLAGAPYTGLATLFGKQYMTEYQPIKNAEGKIVGVLYVGLDATEHINLVKQQIKSHKIGQTGYFSVIDLKAGNSYGNLLVHPAKEGKNMLTVKDADGREFVKDMLESKKGTMRYGWINTELGEKTAREKIVVYDSYKDWNWLVSGGTYTDEITQEVRALRNGYMLAGAVAVLIISGLLYLVITRSITEPLAQATEAAQKLAGGDLSVKLETGRRDEIGQFMQAMNGISHGLATVVAEIRKSTMQITGASSEIAAGNTHLSSRTESQASSLEETASSMEELTGTVQQNAENARQANQLAVSASDVALKGGAVVSQVVDTMGSIKESSRRINDIIGVIDSIAFQTNILALNAAVEAARAGEQGRGFAVVATEVRNLAQRSAGAAKEIKSLIVDSVAKIDAGSQLVDEAGHTMDEIVTSVKRVTDIMSEITVASQEQSMGIDQVNQAIGQMDEITQQNAALVEQAAAAAESMQEQAVGLSELVAIFKLSESKPQAAAVKAEAPELRPQTKAEPIKLKLKMAVSKPSSTSIAVSRKRVVGGGGNGEWEEF